MTFPYAHGLGFVHQFRRRHEWADLGRLYRDPPRATSQILRPERYLDRREDPLPLTLPDLGPVLGAGSRRVFEDEARESGLTGVLREFLVEDATAAGWRGDRYALWEDTRGVPVLVALAVCESEVAADLFADPYARLLARRHGLALPADTGPPPPTWQVAGQAFVVEQRGREVLLLERAPAATLDAVRRAIWQARPGAQGPPAARLAAARLR